MAYDMYVCKYVVMMTKEGSTKIVNCKTHRVGGSCAGGWLIWPRPITRILRRRSRNLQTKNEVMMTKEGSTKIVNFMTSAAGFL